MSKQERLEFWARCGAERKKNAVRIRGALLLYSGHTESSLGRTEGIGAQAVCNTINGRNHSPRVLNALVKFGVPAEYLADPRQVKANAK